MSQAEVLADHTLLLALPAFAPAVVVVGVVIWVAMRDRRSGDHGPDEDQDEEAVSADQNAAAAREDGTP